jgi:hypothetical protein
MSEVPLYISDEALAGTALCNVQGYLADMKTSTPRTLQ